MFLGGCPQACLERWPAICEIGIEEQRGKQRRLSMPNPTAPYPKLALVVDDEIELLDVLKAILVEEADFRVITAALPELVVPLVETAPPEVLLLDLGLPGQSGWDVLAALRENPRFRTLPVLIVSAAEDALG